MFFQENIEYFASFDKAIVYYDNGQRIVFFIMGVRKCGEYAPLKEERDIWE